MPTTTSIVLARSDFGALIAALRVRGYAVIGPRVRDQAIVYEEIQSDADLPVGWTDEQEAGHYRLRRRDDAALFGYVVGLRSWKEFLHPPQAKLVSATRDATGAMRYTAVELRNRELTNERIFVTLERSMKCADAIEIAHFAEATWRFDPGPLVKVILAFLHKRKPNVASHSVCVMTAHGTPCLGPVTHAGCNAICPAYDRGCYGCFGPMESPNTTSLANQWKATGVPKGDILRAFRSYNGYAETFRKESEKHE